MGRTDAKQDLSRSGAIWNEGKQVKNEVERIWRKWRNCLKEGQ
jgi:hypothetical protein